MIKISLLVSDLLQALTTVGVVAPKAGGSDTVAGFTVRVQDGSCALYSRDDSKFTKTSLPVKSSDGTGSFVLPQDMVKGLSYLDGTLSFTAQTSAPWKVTCKSEGGARLEQSSSSPTLVLDCESELEDIEGDALEFAAPVLAMALKMASAHTEKGAEGQEHLKTFRIFGEGPGDGVLFCSSARRAFYFQSDAFLGKSLILHTRNYPAVVSFLTQSGPKVLLRSSPNHYFLEDADAGNVLGWLKDTVTHAKFVFADFCKDDFILHGPADAITRAIKYVQANAPERFQIQYNQDDKTLRFQGSKDSKTVQSVPIPCTLENLPDAERPATPSDLYLETDVEFALDTVNALKGHEVLMRIRLPTDKTPSYYVRTVDLFWADPSTGKLLVSQSDGAVVCQVTRLIPAKSQM